MVKGEMKRRRCASFIDAPVGHVRRGVPAGRNHITAHPVEHGAPRRLAAVDIDGTLGGFQFLCALSTPAPRSYQFCPHPAFQIHLPRGHHVCFYCHSVFASLGLFSGHINRLVARIRYSCHLCDPQPPPDPLNAPSSSMVTARNLCDLYHNHMAKAHSDVPMPLWKINSTRITVTALQWTSLETLRKDLALWELSEVAADLNEQLT